MSNGNMVVNNLYLEKSKDILYLLGYIEYKQIPDAFMFIEGFE